MVEGGLLTLKMVHDFVWVGVEVLLTLPMTHDFCLFACLCLFLLLLLFC